MSPNLRTPGARAARRLRNLHRDDRGQVMFFMAFAMLVLAAMVFLVFNGGDQVNAQVVAQNGADAAAVGGAMWIARGYNLLAMNNVATTELISLAAMLESIGPAIELSYPNAVAYEQHLATYPPASWDPTRNSGSPLTREMWAQVEEVRREATNCRVIMEGMSAWFADMNGKYQDFPAVFSRYPDGVLWRAARGLHDFSTIMIELTPSYAQDYAVRRGRQNGASVAFLTPIYNDLAVYRGTWLDYYAPVMWGLPSECDDNNQTYTIGGYHMLLGYRPSFSTPPNPAAVASYNLSDAYVLRQFRGPFRQFRWDLYSGVMDELRLSGFPFIFARIAQAKIDAVFNDVATGPVPIPRWVLVYDSKQDPDTEDASTAVGLHDAKVNTVLRVWPNSKRNRTCYVRHEAFNADGDDPFPPRYFMLEPDTVIRTDPDPDLPRDMWRWGTGNRIGADPVFWRDRKLRTTDPSVMGADESCPIDGYVPPDKVPPEAVPYWDYHNFRKHFFLGALMDVDRYTTVSDERLMGDKSEFAPYVLNQDAAGIRTRYGYGVWEFIAYASAGGSAKLWSRRFYNPSPTGTNLAYAQVRVHNPSSWDLWTQNWQVRIVPASHVAQVDPARFSGDLARYAQWRSNLTEADVEPVVTLYERLPSDPTVIHAINNH